MNSEVVLLLGRKDEPTDAVEEYCRYLCEALSKRSMKGEIVRVPWNERGWASAVEELKRSAQNWRGRWVFLQYTALAWSERGFPRRVLRVLHTLRDAGARVGVVFHDVEPFAGTRTVDRLRRRVQLSVMRKMLMVADVAVFTVSLKVVSWLGSPANAVFIPVGANLPEVHVSIAVASDTSSEGRRDPNVTRIATYGITGGTAGSEECSEIARATRFAAERGAKLELHAFGRGAAERETELREKLKGVAVTLHFDGLLPAERVAAAIRAADATLFVRGPISTRRGSAIAGIACSKPVIAYQGRETELPITEAGVVLVERKNEAELGQAILRVATDRDFRDLLSERSRRAQEIFFSWRAIAERYVEVMSLKA
ncbi:MAG TPA: glycosyltransferase [Candidatus Acidoferrum sp.]|jgi:glycosyltransferase involved in cell wall biosynthesis